MNTAVAYFIFNRPNHTQKSFDVLRKNKIKTLFIIADGPRDNNQIELEKCNEVRAIVSKIDWPCKVYLNYSDTNLGLKKRISTGLNWVFKHVEKAIILEDDCIPNNDFFYYCEMLLEKYKDNSKIWVITGNNFQDGIKRGEETYYFSKYPHIWGWATWKRAWDYYDGELTFFRKWIKSSDWYEKMPDKVEREYWESILSKVIIGEINTWDYAWNACVWYHGGLTATPSKNLVSNIGFGKEGTNTLETESIYSNMKTETLGEIKHPQEIIINRAADKYTFENNYGGKNYRQPRKTILKIRKLLGRIYRKLKN
jgi:hypothetical protein